MDKETLIREIHDVLGIDAPIFYKIKLLLNEYQRLSITGDVQERCLLARIQTELELLLIGGSKFADPPSKPKIQTALNHVLQKKQHLLTPVEKKIHFVWIGTLGSFQIAYMKTWAYYNPDYEIQLWHDPNALLSGILRQKIKLYAGTLQGIGNNIDVESTASIHVRAIIDLQNEFYKDYFLPGMRQQQTFDDCATQFLLAKGWSTTDQLDEIKSTHAYSFDQAINALNVARSRATQAQPKMPIRLIEINTALFQNTAKKDYYKYYLKELGFCF